MSTSLSSREKIYISNRENINWYNGNVQTAKQ